MAFSRTEDGILFLHPYYPTRFKEHEGVSETIIAFKQGYQIPIDRFTKELEESLQLEINGDSSKIRERCIVIVPSHSKENWSNSLIKVANNISEYFEMENYSKALERTADHAKLATGGDRSIESHMATININPSYDVRDKKVILLDDVTTTGNSIIACARVLKAAGANQVTAITVGRTTSGTLHSAF